MGDVQQSRAKTFATRTSTKKHFAGSRVKFFNLE